MSHLRKDTGERALESEEAAQGANCRDRGRRAHDTRTLSRARSARGSTAQHGVETHDRQHTLPPARPALAKRFGHSLRARTPHAQYAECMLRCIAHNIAMLVMSVQELGINPRYWAADICKTADFGSVLPPATELERVKALLAETEDA
jgi:hypothetical protein